MPLCGFCRQVVDKEPPVVRVAGREPTVDHHDSFRGLQLSSAKCEMCKSILDSLIHGGHVGEYPEQAFRGLRLRVEVDHYLCNPHQSWPTSANDVAAWGLRAYWIREEKPVKLILSKDRGIERLPIWKGYAPGAAEHVLLTISRWISECEETHNEGCALNHSLEVPLLPTRVIDVGTDEEPIEPRLHISNGDRQLYTTLSHCWGKKLPARTMRNTLDSFLTSIPLHEMPKTYLDAFSITRGLGLRYLWIDSLCIIQDDADDWEKESANMASIYRNSYLNIAATSAADGDGGCLFTPRPTTTFEIPPVPNFWANVIIPGQPRPPPPPVEPTLTGLVRPLHALKDVESAPLIQRAWVLQEVCLSRRTIHFTKDQMYWFCAERRASEDGTLSHSGTQFYGAMPSVPVLGPPQWVTNQQESIKRAFVYNMWWSLVEDYSLRDAARVEDKMAALAGLTTFFQEKLGDQPVAGMWKSEFLDSLCWTCDPRQTRASALAGAPSFSWLSVDGPIRRNCCRLATHEPRGRDDERELEILSADVKWSGRPLTSRMAGGTLVARGLLAELTFAIEAPHACSGDHTGHMLLYKDKSVAGRFKFDRLVDVSQGSVFCLAVRHKQRTLNFCPPLDAVYFWFHVLILEPTENGDYRRVGAGKVWANSRVFDKLNPRRLQLV